MTLERAQQVRREAEDEQIREFVRKRPLRRRCMAPGGVLWAGAVTLLAAALALLTVALWLRWTS